MALFARMTEASADKKRTVIEVAEARSVSALAERFVPELADQFEAVPAETGPGSVLTGKAWTHPPIKPPSR